MLITIRQKRERETPLSKAADETGCDNLMVLTWDYEAKEAFGEREIHYLSLWKWLVK